VTVLVPHDAAVIEPRRGTLDRGHAFVLKLDPRLLDER